MRIRIGGLLVLALLAPWPGSALRAEPAPPGALEDAVRSAKTPEQHRAVADAYAQEAARLRSDARAHLQMDKLYDDPTYRAYRVGAIRHCRSLTLQLEAAAKEADALAEMHRAVAAKTAPDAGH